MSKQRVEPLGEVTTHLNIKAARDSAKEVNAPYGNIFTTTPGYLSSKSGSFAKKIYDDSLRWTEKLFDSEDLEALETYVEKNSPGNKKQVVLDFNHRQLGYTDEWLRGKIQDAMSSGEDAGADFLNLWAEGSGASPIDKVLLKIIRDSRVADGVTQISTYGYITRWYAPQNDIDNNFANREIIASLDTSDAAGNDDIGLVFRDAQTGEVLGGGVYNETNLITFSEWIADILLTYPTVTLIVERKSSGVAILDNLIKILVAHGVDPFRRLFNWVVNDYKTQTSGIYYKEVINVPMNRRNPVVYTKYRDKFGFATSGSGRTSRNVLYGEILNMSIKYTGETVRDPVLIDQISGLKMRNGRLDHSIDSKDDMVVAWLLGYWFLSDKTENKEFYGLTTRNILNTVSKAKISEQGGEEEIARVEHQNRLKARIDGLLGELQQTRDPVRLNLLVKKIHFLYKGIDPKYISSFNIETVLENIELSKKIKR